MFSTITTVPSTTIPKSSAPSESRLAGILFSFRQMAANNSENGIVSATMKAPRTLPRKTNRISATRVMPSSQIVHNGLRRVRNQLAAVEKRHDFHARRQDVFIQFLYFGVDAVQRGFRFGALAQQNDAFDRIVVVEDLPVRPVDRLSNLSEPDLRALLNLRDVADAQRRAVLRFNQRL